MPRSAICFSRLGNSISHWRIQLDRFTRMRMPTSSLSTAEQIESIWRLGGLTPKQLAKKVIQEIQEDDLLGRASQLAYNFLLALFPMMLFMLALFGLSASRSAALRANLFYYVANFLPPTAFELFTKTVNEVTTNSGGGKLTFGIILSLWFAAGGMVSLISTLNAVYHVRETRSFIKVRAIALGLTVAISVLTLSALILVLLGGHIANYIGAALQLKSAVVLAWKAVQWIAAISFLISSFSLIYYFGPDVKEQHWYWITPGSVVGVTLWLATSGAFRAYLHFFNTYSKTYGSLGAAIILLIWLYVTGFAFLVGGLINAEIEHAAAEHGHPEAKAEGEKKAA